MDILLRAKHWQIFSGLISIGALEYVLKNESELSGDISYISLMIIQIGWILMLGTILKNRLRNPNKISYLNFIITGIFLLVVTSLYKIVLTNSEIAKIADNVPFFIGFSIYSLVSISIVNGFVAKTIRSIEKNNVVNISDYLGDTLLLIFWPIGIWYIQPRLNKIFDLNSFENF